MINPFHRSGALKHQLEAFERFKDASHFALFWEPRCRKTGVVLNIFRYRHELGPNDSRYVDALVVLSYPSGVKWVWAEEVGYEYPPELLENTKVLVWEAGRTTGTNARKQAALALRDHPGPIVFSANCESILTDKGDRYIEWLMACRRVMLVADETWMANWTRRTRRALAYSHRSTVIVKALLDGSPVDEAPTEIFFPSQFLKNGLLGYSTKAPFEARYCEIGEGTHWNPKLRRRQVHPVINGYRNLDELREKLLAFGSRVRRDEISDAPPKTYVSQFFEMSPRQRAEYERLVEEYAVELESRRVTAREVLYRFTRLQMVARGYWPPERYAEPCRICDGRSFDDDKECLACGGLGVIVETTQLERIDPCASPAIDALLEAVVQERVPFVVWCRFRQDVVDVVAALRAVSHVVVEHHGGVSDVEAEANYQTFKTGGSGAPAGIVGTVGGGLGRGKDLSRAGMSIFYSNDFSLRLRRQAEDRTEGVQRRISTTIIDLVAVGTRDADVVAALRAKRDLAALVMGDPRPWLEATT